MSSLLSPASWVVVREATGEVLFETFNRKLVDALNTAVYRAVPILEYLQGLNTDWRGRSYS
jgi:capsid portal protein